MEHIGSLFSRANASRGEGEVFSAAAALAAVNQVLLRYGYSSNQARAVSLTHRRIKILIAHGAIGGRLRQVSDHLIDDANTLLRQRFPRQAAPLDSFYTTPGDLTAKP